MDRLTSSVLHPSFSYFRAGILLLLLGLSFSAALILIFIFHSKQSSNRIEGVSEIELHYITVATKPHPVLDVLQKVVAAKGNTVTVLGMEENRYIGAGGGGHFGVKLREVHDFVNNESLNADNIVLFSDAYDVYYCGDQDTIVKRFLEFRKPIIFGAERYCWPDGDAAAKYPASDHKSYFPFLNSGLFIGRVGALRKCMRDYLYDDAEDDQRFWTTCYLDHPETIALDHDNQLFLNCAGVEKKELHVDGDQVTFRGATPQLVHSNGGDKSYLDPLLAAAANSI
jgi:hypothetical protein